MNANEANEDEGPTPKELAEEEKQGKNADYWIATFQGMGLQLKDGSCDELVHPEDPEVRAWRNPYTHEVLISPKLKEKIVSIAATLAKS